MTASTSAPAVRSPWKRFLWIGLTLFVLAAVFLLVFWPGIELQLAVNGLATTDQRVLGDLQRRLRESTDPTTDDRLARAVADSDRSFLLRERAAELLVLRNRLSRVEDLARSPDLMTRAVALKVLRVQGNFTRDYLPAPEYRVEETVRGWLADPRRESRRDAISLAMQINLPDLMEKVRDLLDRSKAEGAGRTDANYTLKAAVDAAVQYKDCASVPAVLNLAETDPDWEVRRTSIDAVVALAVGRRDVPALCPGSLPPDRIARFVTGLLDAPGEGEMPSHLRIKVLWMMDFHPEWVAPNAKRVWAALEGSGNGAERRAALAALVEGRDPQMTLAFPRYFHDRNFEVRSTAVDKAARVEGLAPESLWIGVLRDETRSYVAMQEAHAALKRVAGIAVGLPAGLTDPRTPVDVRERELNAFVQEQMQQGSSGGLDREKWTETWFRWLAARHGVEKKEDVDRAVAARKAFRAAMDKKDVGAARAALATVTDIPAPVFLYEQAWLATQP